MRQAGQVIRLSLFESSCERPYGRGRYRPRHSCRGLFYFGGAKIKRSQPSAAPTGGMSTPVGAAEGCDLLIYSVPAFAGDLNQPVSFKAQVLVHPAVGPV